MKIKKFYFLFIAMIFLFSCESDDNTAATEPISVSFEVKKSPDNPSRILVDNTSHGTEGMTSYWQFTEGGEQVADEPGLENHLYEVEGDYLVTLSVETPSGVQTFSQSVSVTGSQEEIPEEEVDPEPDTALKSVATTFSVGMAVQANRLTGMHDEILKREFNNLTAEYEMKMNIMYPQEGNYDFTAADAIVDYAVANDMDVHGHALIWHNATPSWVEDFAGTDDEFETMVEDYITTVLERYKGRVRSWDIVNEAVNDGSNTLRNSVFLERMGEDYIAKCYQFARNADPDVLLFYNDYNIEFDTGKRDATFSIVDNLLTQDLIDGVGAQMHISYEFPSGEQIQGFVDATVSRELLVHFSELDVRANPNNDLTTSLTVARAIQQQAKVREVVEIYSAIPDEYKFAITIWGLRDNETWLINFWGQPDWPLLYDAQFNIKKAHTGFLEGLE